MGKGGGGTYGWGGLEVNVEGEGGTAEGGRVGKHVHTIASRSLVERKER